MVAIETLSGLISKKNKEHFKPFKKPEIDHELQAKFTNALESFKLNMEDMIKVIKSRNVFLHGKNPYDEKQIRG